MRMSYLIAIAAVALGLVSSTSFAGLDYPNNAPAAQPQTLITHQVREIRRVRIDPVSAVYPNNGPVAQPSVVSTGRRGPIVPVTVTYPNNTPQG